MQYGGFGYAGDGSRGAAQEQSLVRYYRVLRERFWLVLLCAVLGLAGAAIYVKAAPRTYQATAEMTVQAAAPTTGVLSSLPVLHQTGDPTEDVLTGASLVTTSGVADAVSAALAKQGVKVSPGAALGAISASPIGQAGLVAVQASASSPHRAKQLADEFVTQTIATTTATMHAAISSELPTLQAQLAGVPAAQRFGPGSLGEQLDQLEQLQHQNNPTLGTAATAPLPISPSSPKTKLTLLAGLLGGILVGVAAAFMLHALDPRLRNEEQVRKLLDLPILTRIPRERYRGRTLPLLPSDMSLAAQEGFRTLRVALTARGQDSGSCLVTGSSPAEGKSTTAISLALALAHGGNRTILIEADVRKPSFAKTFGLENFYGVEDVLIGKVELAQALESVRIENTSIRVLAAHQSGMKLADRMSFAVVRKLLDDAKAQADYVVIDSPPLTEVIDALPFAKVADEVLIVARLDYSRIGRLQALDELLAQHGATAAGMVLVGGTKRQHYYYAESDLDEAGEKPERVGIRRERLIRHAERPRT